MLKKTCTICNLNIYTKDPRQFLCSDRCRHIHHINNTYQIIYPTHGHLLYRAKLKGKCFCCGSENNRMKSMQIDHCHVTGRIRGVVCRSCNVIIGKLEANHPGGPNLEQHHLDWIT